MNEGQDARHGESRFAATQWSLVIHAGGDSASAQPALEKLCQAYWYPLYSFVRRRGASPHDAEDATQGFFMHLIGNRSLAAVDRNLGTFRSFLLASLKNFLSHEYEKANALKRGGGLTAVALDAHTAEERYALEPKDELSPDKLYDRHWALTLLDRTKARLEAEYESSGKLPLFMAIRHTLTGDRDTPYQKLAADLGMTEGALKTAVHRMRDRYRTALRAEVAETVANPEDIDDELRVLVESL